MINRKKINLNKKGFTIVEVLIAVVIILIVLSSLSTLMPHSIKVSHDAQDGLKATDLAQKYLEKVKSDFKYTTLYDAAVAGTQPPIPLTAEYTDNGYYTVATTVTDLETQTIYSTNYVVLKEVNIQYSKSGSTKPLANLSTMIARPR